MTASERTARPAPLRVALWMLGVLASFTSMAVSGREISRELDTFELMFYRSLLAMALILLFAAWSREGFRQLRSRRPGLQVLRNLFHFVGQFGWFYAIALIPLAQVFAIEFTTPLWIALLAPLVLGERLSRTRVLAAVLGFIGVLIVVRPGLATINPGTIAMLIGALGFAGSMMTTKRLTEYDRPVTILFYMTIVQAPIAFLPALGGLSWPTGGTWLWLFAVTLAGLAGHYCLARAFALADAVTVAPLDFLRLPLIALVGMALYAEPLDLWVFLGGGLILLGNYANLRMESRRTDSASLP